MTQLFSRPDNLFGIKPRGNLSGVDRGAGLDAGLADVPKPARGGNEHYRHAFAKGLIKPKPSRRAIKIGNTFLKP